MSNSMDNMWQGKQIHYVQHGRHIMNAIAFLTAIILTGCDDYQSREHGTQALRRLVTADPGSWGPQLDHAAGQHPSPETRTRCARLLGPYRVHLADTYTPSTVPVWPDIDHAAWVGLVTPAERCHWFTMASRDPIPGGTNNSPHWHTYRRATELWVRSMIRCGAWGWSDADVAMTLQWKRELVYFELRPDLPIVLTWRQWGDGYPR